MKTLNTTTSTGVSAWALVGTGVGCVSPNAARQGSGLSFAADYPTVITARMTDAHMTADAKVPDPRGRKR